MIDSANVRSGIAVGLALLGAGCASVPNPRLANTPITEETYRAAARHCHSTEVIRIRPGGQNVFYVSGIHNQTGRLAGGRDIKRIRCVQQYLGIPSEDVTIVYS